MAQGDAVNGGGLGVRTRLQLRQGPASHPDLSDGSVGHKLLRKAGWTPGSGLGRLEQGEKEPVASFLKADRRGVGAETVATLELVGAPQEAPHRNGQKRGREEAQVGPVAGPEPPPSALKQSDADIAAAAQHRAEAARKVARDAAIQRELYHQFAAPGEAEVAGHVLQRSQRSRANPLRRMFT